jgi:ATP-binding cassette subfamily B protein
MSRRPAAYAVAYSTLHWRSSVLVPKGALATANALAVEVSGGRGATRSPETIMPHRPSITQRNCHNIRMTSVTIETRTPVTNSQPGARLWAWSSSRDAADRLVVRIARHGGVWMGVLAVTAVASAVMETLLPAVLGRAVDAVLGGGDAATWLTRCGVLVAIFVACEALSGLADGASSAEGTAWLRHTLLRHVLALGTLTSRRFTMGDLVSRMVGNTAEAGRVGAVAVRAVASVIPSVGSLVALALIDPWLCIAFLVGFPVLALLLRAFIRDSSNIATRYLEAQGAIAARLVDALAGTRTIAAAGTVDREVARVLVPLPELYKHGQGLWRAHTRMASQAGLLGLLEVAVLAVAGFQLTRGQITLGDMLAASQYVVLGMGLGGVVGFFARLSRVRAGARRAAEILAEPPIAYGAGSLPAGAGQLEFRGVTVRVGEERVLDGLDLVVPGGASVAVVGRSGAGKSTLAALAGRLVDPDEGQVLLDGVPLRHVDRRELRREVGYGFDRPALLGETLAEAIGFGQEAPSQRRVEDAARAACANVFIRRFPQGYRTRLADAPMSGGEAQRIGLARAFAHAGRVLVLDDATSSLDTVTELQISRALTGELSDRTRLIVAHRASTAARADLVAWLDGNRVRALGPHHQLWNDPDYRAVFTVDTGFLETADVACARNGSGRETA